MVTTPQSITRKNVNTLTMPSSNLQHWQKYLNASLDIDDVLNTFFDGITQYVPCASLTFTHIDKKLDITLGAKGLHTATYGLKTAPYNLGTLVFTRNQRFSAAELTLLEDGLSLLFYPLRNALLYKEAIDNALTDNLTGLCNRAAFELAIKRELGMAKRHQNALSLVMADVDLFKKINDQAGHHAGDQLLAEVAHALQGSLRETDQIFRIGGEEFVILLANADLTDAQQVAERARKAVEKVAVMTKDRKVGATVSLGVSTYSEGDNRDSLFERADQALYLAKNSGRNCSCTEWDCLEQEQPQRIQTLANS